MQVGAASRKSASAARGLHIERQLLPHFDEEPLSLAWGATGAGSPTSTRCSETPLYNVKRKNLFAGSRRVREETL